MFSKSCEYGLRAVIYIAQQSMLGNKIGVKIIAEAINSPEAFTAKILQKLVKSHIVTSIKGPYGGFVIDKNSAKKITLSDVVTVLDGAKIYTGCGLGLKQCNAKSPCPLHDKFVDVRNDLKKMLTSNTIYDLIETQVTSGNALQLKRV